MTLISPIRRPSGAFRHDTIAVNYSCRTMSILARSFPSLEWRVLRPRRPAARAGNLGARAGARAVRGIRGEHAARFRTRPGWKRYLGKGRIQNHSHPEKQRRHRRSQYITSFASRIDGRCLSQSKTAGSLIDFPAAPRLFRGSECASRPAPVSGPRARWGRPRSQRPMVPGNREPMTSTPKHEARILFRRKHPHPTACFRSGGREFIRPAPFFPQRHAHPAWRTGRREDDPECHRRSAATRPTLRLLDSYAVTGRLGPAAGVAETETMEPAPS